MGEVPAEPTTAYMSGDYGQADYLGIAEDFHFFSDISLTVGAVLVFAGVVARLMAKYFERKHLDKR